MQSDFQKKDSYYSKLAFKQERKIHNKITELL